MAFVSRRSRLLTATKCFSAEPPACRGLVGHLRDVFGKTPLIFGVQSGRSWLDTLGGPSIECCAICQTVCKFDAQSTPQVSARPLQRSFEKPPPSSPKSQNNKRLPKMRWSSLQKMRRGLLRLKPTMPLSRRSTRKRRTWQAWSTRLQRTKKELAR